MNITRETFCRAIGAGIAASNKLTEPEKDALRQVATSAKAVGRAYMDGCPWTLAFGYENGIIGNGANRHPNQFAFAYDDMLLAAAFRGNRVALVIG